MANSRSGRRKILWTLVAAIALCPSFATADNRSIWILNNTGQTIRELYVSPSESGSWGEDALGRAQLRPLVGVYLRFAPENPSSCAMDFKVVFANRKQRQYHWENVCSVVALQFDETDLVPLARPRP